MTPKKDVVTDTTAQPAATPTAKPAKKTAPKKPAAPKGKAKPAAKKPAAPAPKGKAKPAAPANGVSKKAQLIALAEKGVTIETAMKKMGWLRWTVRGFFSVLGKTRKVSSAVVDGHLTYTVAPVKGGK